MNPDPRLDALEDLRCDEMAREEQREAREDAQRAEDKQEREEARREIVQALKPPPAPPATHEPPSAPPTALADAPSERGAVDLTGLWAGYYGAGRLETVRIEQHDAVVTAVKVTGDTNVPAGKPTFRAFLSGKESNGEGHVADDGYTNPRWIPGRLLILGDDSIEFSFTGVGSVRYRRMAE